MSTRRKPNPADKIRRRLAVASAPLRFMEPDTSFLDSLPPNTRANYHELAETLLKNPTIYEMIGALSDHQIVNIVVALAYPDLVDDPPQQQRLDAARVIRFWHMVNKVDEFIPGWPPLCDMTNEEILDRIDADRDAGLIPRP